MKPEEEARQQIDILLEATGWMIQNYGESSPTASTGVVVRDFINSMNSSLDYGSPGEIRIRGLFSRRRVAFRLQCDPKPAMPRWTTKSGPLSTTPPG